MKVAINDKLLAKRRIDHRRLFIRLPYFLCLCFRIFLRRFLTKLDIGTSLQLMPDRSETAQGQVVPQCSFLSR